MIDIAGDSFGVTQAQKDLALKIVLCEDVSLDPTKQSEMRYRDGSREMSYGLVQIHLPAHPNITYSQAVDPGFSIGFLMEQIKAGKAGMWSCYHIVTRR